MPESIKVTLEWVFYDGTPETLPEPNMLLLLNAVPRNDEDDDYLPCGLFYGFYCSERHATDPQSWGVRLLSSTSDDRFYPDLKVGDVWGYIPMPPASSVFF